MVLVLLILQVPGQVGNAGKHKDHLGEHELFPHLLVNVPIVTKLSVRKQEFALGLRIVCSNC